MGEEPLVSVIVNCFNGEKYLRQAIDSVLSQTYQNWEIIFWDNRSTDRSAEIYESYADPRLRYFLAPRHTKLYEARNYALEKANGEVLGFLDVDDWWLRTKLERQVPLFLDPDVGFVCGEYWVESERKNKRWILPKRPAPTGWVLNDLLKFYFIGLVTLMVRRSALDSLDYPCDPRYHMIGDLDLAVRIALDWKLGCVREPVACYRLHDGNETAKHHGLHNDEMTNWWKEMSEIEAIRSCPDSRFMNDRIVYSRGLYQILQGEKKRARGLSRDLPWGWLKFRLWALLLTPASLVRRIRD
jgi:glycosyltransferase involved in cell wall biosynthesis